MRNPRRQPGPIRRTAPLDRSQPVSRNLAVRQPDESALYPSGHGRVFRARATAKGQAGPWAQPAHLPPTDPAMIPAWSLTKSDFR